jgi:hypothetical protein
VLVPELLSTAHEVQAAVITVWDDMYHLLIHTFIHLIHVPIHRHNISTGIAVVVIDVGTWHVSNTNSSDKLVD